MTAFLKVLREEGIKGLYCGLTASYLGVSESILQWVLYEKMKKAHLARREEQRIALGREATNWDAFVTWGGILGAAGSALTYPHEVVRTRLRQFDICVPCFY